MVGEQILFWIFSTLLLLSGLLVILSVSPVASAMFLILLFFFMACLFVLLDAFFLAIIQILVYAGAVMVLFLFVIMLLDAKEPRRWWWKNTAGLIGAPIAACSFLLILGKVLGKAQWPQLAGTAEISGAVREIVRPLFAEYMLPFVVTSLLLLVATIGVVLLGRREGNS